MYIEDEVFILPGTKSKSTGLLLLNMHMQVFSIRAEQDI